MKKLHAVPISSGSADLESWIDPNFSVLQSSKFQPSLGVQAPGLCPFLLIGNREWGIGNRLKAILHSRFSFSRFTTQAARRPPKQFEVRSS
jgi:hypothetical protein